jgi:hypothetical protein
MKRVAYTPFSTPTRSIGRDAELTIALIQVLGRAAGVKSTRFNGILDLIKTLFR